MSEEGSREGKVVDPDEAPSAQGQDGEQPPSGLGEAIDVDGAEHRDLLHRYRPITSG